MKIHKYHILPAEHQIIRLPERARFLDVQVQHGSPALWVMVDTELPEIDYEVFVVGTGWDVPEFCHYIGTYQLYGGDFVWHVFVRLTLDS